MDICEYQPILKLIFAKLANEIDVRYKLPKLVCPNHFNVFFKNLRVKGMKILEQRPRDYFLYMAFSVDIKKTISELIKEYGYHDNSQILKRHLFRFEEHGDFISINTPYSEVRMLIYDKDIRRLFDYYTDDNDHKERYYSHKGFFSRDGHLFVHKDLIDHTYIFFELSYSLEEEITKLFNGDILPIFTEYGC